MDRGAYRKKHLESTHERWAREKLANMSHFDNQCGGCDFYIALMSPLGEDWGVCSNASSEHDATAVFEHYSCPAFSESPTGWDYHGGGLHA